MFRNRCMDMNGMNMMGTPCMNMGEMPAMDKSFEMKEMEMSMNPGMGMGCGVPLTGIMCAPVMECPQEKCFHREIIHEVPHIQPINTKIINHHIYKHSVSPCYSCCEENVCTNVFEGPRCGC